MQAAADSGASNPSGDRIHSHHSIVSELASLVAHVEAGMRLLDAAIASETASGDQDTVSNVFILDDITPSYLQANAALNACNAGLGVALHGLLDAGDPAPKPPSLARATASRLT